jgi:hypothetical protein
MAKTRKSKITVQLSRKAKGGLLLAGGAAGGALSAMLTVRLRPGLFGLRKVAKKLTKSKYPKDTVVTVLKRNAAPKKIRVSRAKIFAERQATLKRIGFI